MAKGTWETLVLILLSYELNIQNKACILIIILLASSMMCQHKNKSVSISTYRPYRASTVSDRIDDIMRTQTNGTTTEKSAPTCSAAQTGRFPPVREGSGGAGAVPDPTKTRRRDPDRRRRRGRRRGESPTLSSAPRR